MIRYLKNFLSLLYPALCVGCEKPLYEHEELICSYCWYHLPVTNFHQDQHNAAAKQLWGRVKLEFVTSYLYFIKASNVQHILHHLKYFDAPAVGAILGKRYGELLNETGYSNADIIVPVPLHPKKLRKRGYNQSEYFAEGLSKSMQLPIAVGNLVRHTLAESQTTKKRFERYENMKAIFDVTEPKAFINKHVLLVDDVLTTGATIEACASKLLAISGVKVSVVTLAYTK